MSEAKHTPGPWVALWANDYLTGNQPVEIAAPTGHPIAEVVRVDPAAGGDHTANARLIAAAPELLAACMAFVACPADERHAIDLELIVEAAIAKALGQRGEA